MDDKMFEEKFLNLSGKESLFNSFEEYLDAKIEMIAIELFKKGASKEFTNERIKKNKERTMKAQKDLKDKLMALKIQLSG